MNLVRTFVTVYQQNSFTRAADILDVSQPAVSMSIRRLEASIGTTLFVKDGRSIAPTGKAIELAEKLQHGMQIIDSALAEEHTYNIYCLEGVSDLLSDEDNIDIKVPPFEQGQLLEKIRSQQIDLAIDIITTQDKAFNIEQIRHEEVTLICRRGHPRISNGVLTEEDFYRERHAYYKATRGGHQFVELLASKPLKKRKLSREVYNQASMAMLVSDSDYLGIVFRSFAEKWAPKLGLDIYPMPMEFQSVPIHMLYHRRLEHDPEHKLLRERLKTTLRVP
ncbi:LysR family transcriptional regulator [Vibrio sp. WXL210]|uniref:LysR family transcriptional regulator n=1 Tax=Vibrio sp. WXL210 TaxID=3450709 RepID=UPI003EC51C85